MIFSWFMLNKFYSNKKMAKAILNFTHEYAEYCKKSITPPALFEIFEKNGWA